MANLQSAQRHFIKAMELIENCDDNETSAKLEEGQMLDEYIALDHAC